MEMSKKCKYIKYIYSSGRVLPIQNIFGVIKVISMSPYVNYILMLLVNKVTEVIVFGCNAKLLMKNRFGAYLT